MEKSSNRGSENLVRELFGRSEISAEDLSRAVAGIQASGFSIVRWWWKGQPAIEQIFAKLHVAPTEAPRTIEGLLGVHSAEVQVGLEVFPYGIVSPDMVEISVTMNKNLQKI